MRLHVTSAGRVVSSLVSLDVLPANVPAEYAPAMVAACSQALTEGKCVLASALQESQPPQAVALVLWQGDGFLQCTVRVGRGGGKWVVRSLTFAEKDSIEERWTTVGLTVATLVGEASASSEPVAVAAAEPQHAAPETAPTPRAAAPRPVPTPLAPRPPIFHGSLGASVGPGWDSGGFQFGGYLLAGMRLGATPLVAHVFGSYAASRGPTFDDSLVKSRFTMLGAGLGVTGAWAALDLGAAASLELAYRRVDVSFAGQAPSSSDAPLRIRGSLSYPAQGTFGGVAGAAIRIPTGASSGTRNFHLAAPTLEGELFAGVEVRL